MFQTDQDSFDFASYIVLHMSSLQQKIYCANSNGPIKIQGAILLAGRQAISRLPSPTFLLLQGQTKC